MKRCGACGEEFQNRFNFCPVDGETLIEPEIGAINYSPTIISDVSLARRLLVQLPFLIERLPPVPHDRAAPSELRRRPRSCCGRRDGVCTAAGVEFRRLREREPRAAAVSIGRGNPEHFAGDQLF